MAAGTVEILLLAAGLVVFVTAIAAIILAVRARGGNRKDGELVGRLSQLAETIATDSLRLSERFQAQERTIAKALDEKLAEVNRRVGDTLEKTAKRTHDSMSELRERLVKIDEAQKNITELSVQVVGLQDILANKQARGAFGEIQLNDLVSAALPPAAYRFQTPLGNGRIVDCLLTLPNPPGSIAIDAKFPLESYYKLRKATDEAASRQAGREFATAITTHIRHISERYIVAGETAESALMFLPSEAIYAELHANFPEVVAKSYRARVWIVSPTTLMATLNTVRAVLKDAHMREQAGVIQKEVHLLLDDVARLDKRTAQLEKHFGQANEDVRSIRISSDKITRRSERIEEIELGPDGEEDATPPLAPATNRLLSD